MQLKFVFHLANLPVGTLGRDVFDRMEANGLKGLVTDIAEHLDKLNFEVNRSISKWSWKKLVKDYVRNKCRNELLESMKIYKKLDYEKSNNEEFKRKQYFYDLNLEQIRFRFKASSNMLESFKANFPSKYKNQSLRCKACTSDKQTNEQTDQPRDTQDHNLTSCSAYYQLRQQYDLNTDIGIINSFKAVIKQRIETEDS